MVLWSSPLSEGGKKGTELADLIVQDTVTYLVSEPLSEGKKALKRTPGRGLASPVV